MLRNVSGKFATVRLHVCQANIESWTEVTHNNKCEILLIVLIDFVIYSRPLVV